MNTYLKHEVSKNSSDQAHQELSNEENERSDTVDNADPDHIGKEQPKHLLTR